MGLNVYVKLGPLISTVLVTGATRVGFSRVFSSVEFSEARTMAVAEPLTLRIPLSRMSAACPLLAALTTFRMTSPRLGPRLAEA